MRNIDNEFDPSVSLLKQHGPTQIFNGGQLGTVINHSNRKTDRPSPSFHVGACRCSFVRGLLCALLHRIKRFVRK